MDQQEYSNLQELFAALPDPRKARGKRHSWGLILTLIGAALVSGARGMRAISQWAEERRDELCQHLAPPRGRLPSDSTLRRALRVLDLDDLEARAAALPAAPGAAPSPGGRATPVGLAMDGKKVNGANAHGAQVHLLSLVRHADARVIRQREVAVKSNEIPAAPRLLAGLDLTDTVVTMDALLTQKAVAAQIRRQGGHYLMVVKDNQPALAAAIDTLFTGGCPPLPSDHLARHTTVDKRHGRLETRTLERSAALNAYLTDWPDVGQVLRRTCRAVLLKTGAVRQEVTYGLSSLPAADTAPALLERLWRGHWTIENRVHYVRDVTFGEDAGQAWVGNTPHALATLRNLLLATLRAHGWANIADALRHYGAYTVRALTLLGARTARL
jgi:predicted transposase YbfD/YdcC